MDFMWRLDDLMRKYAWWRKWRGLPEPRPMSPVIQFILRATMDDLERNPPAFLDLVSERLPPPVVGGTIRIRRPTQYAKRA